MVKQRLTFRVHAVQRMAERGISLEDVQHVLHHGEVIETYPQDTPYPSRLLLGWSKTRPIHLVVAEDVSTGEVIVITVYQPDAERWREGYRRRKSS